MVPKRDGFEGFGYKTRHKSKKLKMHLLHKLLFPFCIKYKISISDFSDKM